MGHPSPKCTAEFKQRAVQLYRERGTTYAEVAWELGVDPSSLADWVKRSDAARAAPGDNPFKIVEENRKLRPRGREAQEGERDTFKREHLLRQQAAVGAQAGRTKFEFILANEGTWAVSELHRRGVSTSRKRVARTMRENGRAGITRGRAKRPKDEPRQAAPDLVRREFSADGARFADITYVRTHQSWLYLAVVMDIWSRMIVGWSMSPRMTADLADDALKMAIARQRPEKGCIHHSGHGSQYVSLLLGRTMRDAGIEPSIGSISSPWDSAAMESLMGLIKAGCVHARTFETRERATLEIFEYIECFYNRVRIHSALGNLSPEEFEARNLKDAAEEKAA